MRVGAIDMATLKQMKTNFVSGEIDPKMIARSDIKHYHNAARYMRNVVSLPQGGFSTRPGTTFMDKLPASNVRLAAFQYTTDEAYLFVFTPLKVSIYYEGSKVAEVATPYTADQLVSSYDVSGRMLGAGINWSQTLEEMIVYHESHAPRIIKRGSSHSSWTIATAAFDNIPRFDFGAVYTNGVNEVQKMAFNYRSGSGGNWTDGDTFVLILEGEETDTILVTVNNSSTTMASRIQSALRQLPNVFGSGITVTATNANVNIDQSDYIVTFGGRDGQRPWGVMGYRVMSSIETPNVGITMQTRGERPGEPAISNARGWPRCGVFYQGRHWMAGSKSLPNTVFVTRAATDWDLNNKKLTDDYGFMYSSDTDDVPIFLNIYAGRHLQLFSTAGEFYVPISDREGVTPKNMALRRTTSRGMKAGTRVHEVDGATLFVQAGGSGLIEFIFADAEAAYQANSISVLASHLMENPLAMTLRKATSTDSADLIFMPNPNGSMTVFCTLRTQEVNAFTLWETKGKYKDACAVYDDVYFAVTRVIDDQEFLFIEQMDDRISVDCGIVYGASSDALLSWLPNSGVSIVLDDAVQQDQVTGSDGSLTYDRPAVREAIIGLPWPEVMPDKYPKYKWVVETLPVDAELQDGVMFGRKRRIVKVSFRMHETNGLVVNNSRVAMRHYGAGLLDKPNPRTSDIKTMAGFLGYDYDGKVSFGETTPTQSTVLALSWAVSV